MDYSSGANIHPSSINPLNNDKKIKKNEKGNAVQRQTRTKTYKRKKQETSGLEPMLYTLYFFYKDFLFLNLQVLVKFFDLLYIYLREAKRDP